MARARLCCVLLLVLAPAVLAAEHPAVVTPLFAWGNQPSLLDESASREVFPSLEATLSNILADAYGAAESAASRLVNINKAQADRPDVVLVVVGSQLRTSDVRQNHRTGHLKALQQLLDEASSAAVVPHVLHELQDLGMDQPADLVEQLSKATTAAKVVKCHGMSGLTEALEQDLSAPTVLLMHTQLEEGVGGTPAGLQTELHQVQAAHKAVAGLGKKQLTLYGVVPEAATLVQQRRLLANVQADVGTCGQLCQTQVKWLEGIMALGILTFASVSGLMCMYLLDTPTKFQLPKERERAQ